MSASIAFAMLASSVPVQAEAKLPETISVRVLEHEAPAALEMHASIGGHRVSREIAADGEFDSVSGDWTIVPDGGAARRYRGVVRVRQSDHGLSVVVEMTLEEYVASVVASESLAGTPRAALEALAIVVRSWAASSESRHGAARVCDLAHCQVLDGRVDSTRESAARAAAKATAGRVLRLGTGAIAKATFHAACGGHTAEPSEIFGGEGSGAAAAADDACEPRPWHAQVPRAIYIQAMRETLRNSGEPAVFPPEQLELTRGAGGAIVQIATPAGSERIVAAGDLFARSLDRVMGYGVVRGDRFDVSFSKGDAVLTGNGFGHLVGLCQEGASARAKRGERAEEILAHYFPLASVR